MTCEMLDSTCQSSIFYHTSARAENRVILRDNYPRFLVRYFPSRWKIATILYFSSLELFCGKYFSSNQRVYHTSAIQGENFLW